MADVLLSEGKCSSRSYRCEWKNGPDDLVCIMILLCRLISDDMIVVETICLWRVVLCHCDGMYSTDCDYVSLVSSRVLLGVVVYHWIVVVYYYG
jgi:hypothetical protein